MAQSEGRAPSLLEHRTPLHRNQQQQGAQRPIQNFTFHGSSAAAARTATSRGARSRCSLGCKRLAARLAGLRCAPSSTMCPSAQAGVSGGVQTGSKRDVQVL